MVIALLTSPRALPCTADLSVPLLIFSIAVTAYLLVHIEAKLSDLTASIAELARAIEAGGSK